MQGYFVIIALALLIFCVLYRARQMKKIGIKAFHFYGAMDAALAGELPLLLVISHDMAKALGQAIEQLAGGRREIIAIDSVVVEDGDYVDLGRPVMNGMAVPVIVKTLILG